MIALIALIFAGLGVWVNLLQGPTKPVSTVAASNPTQLFFQSEFPESSSGVQKMAQWQGKPLIINFWASWCPPCIREMPELSAFSRQVRKHGIQVIGVGVDSREHITDFAKAHPVDYPLYIADIAGTELSRQLGNETGGLPFTVLIGSDGKIKKTYSGILNFLQLNQDIQQVIK